MRPDTFRNLYRRTAIDTEKCEEFLSVVDDSDLCNFMKVGLIVIAPETFAIGAAHRLAACIENSGFHLLDAAVVDPLSIDEITMMFVPKKTPLRFRFWFLERRYALGPTAALLVTHPSVRAVGSVLKQAKGRARPSLARTGTWRRDAGAINGVLNLVHTADGPEQVLRHGAPFFSVERFQKAARNSERVKKGAQPPLSWKRLHASVFHAYGSRKNRNLSFLAVYRDLLHRLVMQEWRRREDATLERVTGRFGSIRDPDREIDEFASAIRMLRSAIKLFGPHQQSALHMLLSLNDSNVDWDRRLAGLVQFGVGIDGWEHLVLATTLHDASNEVPMPILQAVRGC